MCGRFTQTALERYADLFRASAGIVLPPRYNIAPSQQIVVCRRSEIGWRELSRLRWGLIPHWAKDPKTSYSLINARAETVAEKPAYRDAFEHRRCLIPTDGFYEFILTHPIMEFTAREGHRDARHSDFNRSRRTLPSGGRRWRAPATRC